MIAEILQQSLQRTERAIVELQQPTIEIERTRNAIRETQKRNDGLRAELEAYKKELRKVIKQYEKAQTGSRELQSVKKEISRLGGLIAWQDNRSKQFKTIIERGY